MGKVKKIRRSLGNGVELTIELYPKINPSERECVKMHIADHNYGLLWWPDKKTLQKLHKIIGECIEQME